MRVFVQCGITGLPFNETVFCAYHGFVEMGCDYPELDYPEELSNYLGMMDFVLEVTD